MKAKPPATGSHGQTRGRIIDLIRRSPTTVTDIASRLGLTYTAVRSHLSALERDGLIRTGGMRRGGTKPAVVYELAPGADDVLSRAYMPFASHLVRALTERLPEPELDEIMRDVGSRLAAEWPRPQGTLGDRVENMSALLTELGAPNEIERTETGWRIRGFGCLLAATVHNRPHVCRAMESLLTTLVNVPVRECCDRLDRPRCCFEIETTA